MLDHSSAIRRCVLAALLADSHKLWSGVNDSFIIDLHNLFPAFGCLRDDDGSFRVALEVFVFVRHDPHVPPPSRITTRIEVPGDVGVGQFVTDETRFVGDGPVRWHGHRITAGPFVSLATGVGTVFVDLDGVAVAELPFRLFVHAPPH